MLRAYPQARCIAVCPGKSRRKRISALKTAGHAADWRTGSFTDDFGEIVKISMGILKTGSCTNSCPVSA